MRLYISGPITDTPNHRENFEAAQRVLLMAGYETTNPLQVHPIVREGNPQWLTFMRGDIAAMMYCDGVATIDNHHKSRGAKIETDLAFALGLPVASVDFWVGYAK